jgi:hypothetical protein
VRVDQLITEGGRDDVNLEFAVVRVGVSYQLIRF